LTNAETHYWNTIAQIWREAHAHALWRTHSDAVNSTLLEEWWPKDPVGRVLKTDLFEETLGNGLYPLLALRANHIIGMDVSTVTAQAAVTCHGDLHAVGADARCLPFIDEAFDVIVSNSTLDHFVSSAELGASLHELHRVLKTPGLLIITLDNRANPMVALRNAAPFPLLHRLGLVPYYVGATCGPRGLRHLLQQTGFHICETSAIMHCPRVLAVLTARLLTSYAGTKTQRRFLQWLLSFERLSCWPTRFLTGHFVAVRALKR
jgi:SAM-dependent methyltransferase